MSGAIPNLSDLDEKADGLTAVLRPAALLSAYSVGSLVHYDEDLACKPQLPLCAGTNEVELR